MFGFTLTEVQKTYLSHRKFVFAANFHNNGQILGAMIPEYLALFSLLGSANVFVTIFENGKWCLPNLARIICLFMWHLFLTSSCFGIGFPGSKDNTKDKLREFAAELAKLNVAHHIVLSDAKSWNATRADMSERIAFMARVRNAALVPLLATASSITPHYNTSNDLARRAAVIATLDRQDGGLTRVSPPSHRDAEAATIESIEEISEWVRGGATEVLSSVVPKGSPGSRAYDTATAFPVTLINQHPLQSWTANPDATSILFINDVYFTVS